MRSSFIAAAVLLPMMTVAWGKNPTIKCRPINATEQNCDVDWGKEVNGQLIVANGHQRQIIRVDSDSVGWPVPMGIKPKFVKFVKDTVVESKLLFARCEKRINQEACHVQFDRVAKGNLILMTEGAPAIEFQVNNSFTMLLLIPQLPDRISFTNKSTGTGNWVPPTRGGD